jgi:hypothetical protein
MLCPLAGFWLALDYIKLWPSLSTPFCSAYTNAKRTGIADKREAAWGQENGIMERIRNDCMENSSPEEGAPTFGGHSSGAADLRLNEGAKTAHRHNNQWWTPE